MNPAGNFWDGFDPVKQRAYVGPGGPVIVDVAAPVLALRYIEPTDAEMERGVPFETRIERAKELAANGHVVDTQIDVWGWGAENTMRLRRMYGYASVPDASGSIRILVPPGKKL